MGCGGAKANQVTKATQEDVGVHEDEPEQVWATKTEAAKRPAQQSPAATNNASGGGPTSGSNAKAFVLEDADDEIEIVDEGNQQQPPSQAKGNGWSQHKTSEPERPQQVAQQVGNAQEAPQWGGSDNLGNSKAVDDLSREADEQALKLLSQGNAQSTPNSTKPLPKQQAEEAAKLAETRKRFDNQRYSKPNAATPSRSAAPAAAATPPAVSVADNVCAVPLSLTNSVPTPSKDSGKNLGAFLPGGVLDDLELNDFAGANDDDGPDDKKSDGGFDEADEALMKEILEDCDDV